MKNLYMDDLGFEVGSIEDGEAFLDICDIEAGGSIGMYWTYQDCIRAAEFFLKLARKIASR